MRLLDRFLLRELAIPLAYCLAGFLLFWISFDLFTELDDFQDLHLRARDIAELYWVRLPDLLMVVLPIGFLLALLYTLANHSRHHEITAMRSAGISLWRICLPYLVVGVFFSAALFWMSERLAPDSDDRERQIKARHTREGPESQWIQGLNFRNARDNRIWTIGAYNPDTREMNRPQVDWRLPDGSRRTLIARSAIRTNNVWQFSNVQFFIYPTGGTAADIITLKTNSMSLPELTETPADIRVQIKFSKLNAVKASKRAQLSLREIDYIENHLELNPRDRAILESQRHLRLSQPWTCLIVALIAIPFGAASGRRNVFIGVAASIFICFAYFILQRVGLALANGQYIPPAIGAWSPNVLFGITGLWLTHRVK
jgi:lipopolysaccharide export system permease protein